MTHSKNNQPQEISQQSSSDDLVAELRRIAAKPWADGIWCHRAADEIERLTRRCYPSKISMIDGTGHYVSEAVHAHIERLELALSRREDKYIELVQERDRLAIRQAELLDALSLQTDETDRLRDELARYKGIPRDWVHQELHDAVVAECAQLRDENAQLITDNSAGCMSVTQVTRENDRLRADVERMTAERDDYSLRLEQTQTDMQCDLNDLKAERDRLRAALQLAKAWLPHNYHKALD